MGFDKCVLACCPNNKESTFTDDRHAFKFPSEAKRPDLYDDWIRFVNRANGWNPSASSVLCHLHFEEKFIKKGKRWTMNWNMQPVPTIYPEKLRNTPSILPTPRTKRKAPTERVYLSGGWTIKVSGEGQDLFIWVIGRVTCTSWVCLQAMRGSRCVLPVDICSVSDRSRSYTCRWKSSCQVTI